MKNNNREVVIRLSDRSLRHSRGRNIIAVAAIILTTFMITSVFSIGISFGKNLSIMLTRLNGTAATIFLEGASNIQTESIKALKGVEAVGTQIGAGTVRAKTAEGREYTIGMVFYDDTEWKRHALPAIGNITGEYPEAENEIMLSDKALQQLGIDTPSIGQSVHLTYNQNNSTCSGDFVLCGWYTDYVRTQSSGTALVSEKFVQGASLSVQNNGGACISAKKYAVNSVYDTIDKQIKTETQKLSSSTSSQQESSKSTLAVILTIVMIALFIVFSGYLLIYNIMYISVTKDIHFYGLLKTLGTSPKQIKTIVRRQIFLLSGIGIPIGLLLGLLASFGIVPLAMSALANDGSSSSAMPSDISFSPIIFAGTALFSFFTVIVSCRKPAKIASRVSPVEAVRYTAVRDRIKKTVRKTTSGGKLSKMSFNNVFRDKKRAVLVFASLFMGTITFLSTVSFLTSLDINNFIDRYHPHDFQYQSIPPLSEDKFDKKFIESINEMEGITKKELVRSEYCTTPFDAQKFETVLRDCFGIYSSELGINSFEEFAESIKLYSEKNGYGTRVYSVDTKYVEEYNRTHDKKVDLEAFRRGEVCIAGYFDNLDLSGMTLELTSETTGNKKSITVAGTFNHSSSCDFAKYAYAIGTIQGLFVSEEFLNSLNPDAFIAFIYLDAKPDCEPEIRAGLDNLNKNLANTAYDYTAKSEQAESFSSTMATMNILTGGISALLILIGVINFINVMITSVFSRKRELAVLESIGMTKKQILSMLTLEGGYYALITSALILTLGNAVMLAVGSAVTSVADYAKFTYPAAEVAMLISLIFAVCLIVPPIVYKAVCKETVTERLHASDS